MKRKNFSKILCLLIIFTIISINKTYANTIENTEESISVEYEYDEKTNQVIARIISSIELKDTKPTWNLSDDKKIYTKIYNKNEIYNTEVIDINGNRTILEININLIKELEVEIQYNYNKITGQVVAKITSNIELKDTKPTWNLSDDKYIYTKVFTGNTVYQTNVEDKYGNIKTVTIKIDQIGKEKPQLQVIDDYDSTKNQVVCKIISDVPLKNTKPTWQLSENKLEYLKVFEENMDYYTAVEDVYGNRVNVHIKITKIDKIAPEIKLEYKYNDDDTITVCMRSNEELGDTKPTWNLSEDKMTYEKVFDNNQSYYTIVQDIYGNKTNVKIDFRMKKFEYIQSDKSKIKVRYLYIGREKAIVEIVSSIKMKDTKPTWTLSEDGYKYVKEYYKNEMYTTYIQDVNNNEKEVNIQVRLFENYFMGIDVSYAQGIIDYNKLINAQDVDFMIARAGWYSESQKRFIVDVQFERNYKEARNKKIPLGTYIYSYATTVDEAKREAYGLINYLKSTNQTNYELPIFYDVEDKSQAKVDKKTMTQIIITFCEIVKNAGFQPGVYANLDWYTNHMNLFELPEEYDLWIAHYKSQTDSSIPEDIYKYARTHDIWQYTSAGTVYGIEGKVDKNICYKKYFE